MNQAKLIDMLAKRRENEGVSYAELAKVADCSAAAVQYVFTGVHGTAPERILKIAERLGVKVQYTPANYKVLR